MEDSSGHVEPAVLMCTCTDLLLKLSQKPGRDTAFSIALNNIFLHFVRRFLIQKNHGRSGFFPVSIILGIYMAAEKIDRSLFLCFLLFFPGFFLVCIPFHILV